MSMDKMINRRRALVVLIGAVAVGAHAQPVHRSDRRASVHEEELLTAAARGDAAAARDALQAGAALETRDRRGRTPLLLAALGDHVEAAKVLVTAGADPDAQDDQQDSAFLVTGVTGSAAMLRTLLPAHPDLTLTNRFGGTALIPACERGHVDYVRAIVKTGINVNHINRLGWTGLLEAVILGDGSAPYQQIIKLLIAAGADVNLADSDDVSPRQHAQKRHYDRIAGQLTAAGAH